jgi:hypothetical protein
LLDLARDELNPYQKLQKLRKLSSKLANIESHKGLQRTEPSEDDAMSKRSSIGL